MTPRSAVKRIARRSLALWMIALMACASIAPAANAQVDLDGGAATIQATEPLGADPPAEADRWWGVLGGALCAFETRYAWKVPAIGMNPYMIAAGLGGCILALMDVCSVK